MGLAVKIFILVGLIRLLLATESPILVTVIYTIAAFLIGLLSGFGADRLILGVILTFVVAFVYFWLLNTTKSSLLWWIICLGGIFIGLV